MAEASRSAKQQRSPLRLIVALLILVALFALAVGPITPATHSPFGNVSIQTARVIGLCLFAYANDHQGKYPTGKSSTEVFQKLIDEQYCTDSSLFFEEKLRIPGKIKETSNILKPENVCWDITVPADNNSPDSLPLVFVTGYKINYVSGGNAIPLFHESGPRSDGLAVCCKDNTAYWKKSQPGGIVTNFISPNFDPKGIKYQQLTPDGPLAP